MHFLIGFLIVCVILAVPGLRKAAFVVIGLTALGLVLLLANSSSKPTPAVDAQQTAAQQAAWTAMQQAEEKTRHLISTGEIEVRQFSLTSNGNPVKNVAAGSISDPGLTAVIRNNSPTYTLTEIAFGVELFDCPLAAKAITERCDQIGSYRGRVTAEVPPGQVRQMTSPYGYASAIDHLPPIRGQLTLRHAIESVKGKGSNATPPTSG